MTSRQQMIANIEKMIHADDKFRSLDQDDQQDLAQHNLRIARQSPKHRHLRRLIS